MTATCTKLIYSFVKIVQRVKKFTCGHKVSILKSYAHFCLFRADRRLNIFHNSRLDKIK